MASALPPMTCARSETMTSRRATGAPACQGREFARFAGGAGYAATVTGAIVFLQRARLADMSWPPPEDMTDEVLEALSQ